MSRWAAIVALVFAIGLIALAVADLSGVVWVNEVGQNQIAAAVLTEAVLLLGAYLIVDDLIAKRDRRQWNLAAASHVNSLGYRVDVLHNRFEAAIQALDDTAAWNHFLESVKWFRIAVDRSGSILTTTADLAAILSDAEKLAHLAEWFVSRGAAQLAQELTNPDDAVPRLCRRYFPVMARQLLQSIRALEGS
jgi:hypothetical protein